MNNLDQTYQALLQDILDNGVRKEDRTGTGTISVFGRQIRHKMSEGYPLLTTKKMPFKTIVTELLWFLRGDTNIKYLVDNNCHIWDGDAYKSYLDNVKSVEEGKQVEENGKIYTYRKYTKEEFIDYIKNGEGIEYKAWADLGPIYGKQWRDWNGDNFIYGDLKNGIDQIKNLINDLKTNPDSRRLMVSAWNVGELDKMTLPPCHYGFQVYTRELSREERMKILSKTQPVQSWEGYMKKDLDAIGVPKRAISLMWNQRSVDTFLGLPFNIASYGLLLEIIAKEVNMVPDELIGNLGDVHLYSNHIEQAKEQIGIELSLEERIELASKDPVFDPGDFGVGEQVTDEHCHEICDSYSVPRKTREPFKLPKLGMDYREGEYNKNLTDFVPDDFYLIDYQSHPTIKAPLSN
jgi:thymidylate synthase